MRIVRLSAGLMIAGGIAMTTFASSDKAEPAKEPQTAATVPAPASEPTTSDRVAKLEREIAELKQQNAALRERLADANRRATKLQQDLAQRRVAEVRVPLQLQPRQPDRTRENWKEEEINGIRYYLVPLHGERPVVAPANPAR